MSNTTRILLTVKEFSKRHSAFPEAGLRSYIFNAADRFSSSGEVIPGNKLEESGALIRIGRKVLLDETKFFQWLDMQQARRG